MCSQRQELSSLEHLIPVWLLSLHKCLSSEHVALEISHLVKQWNECIFRIIWIFYRQQTKTNRQPQTPNKQQNKPNKQKFKPIFFSGRKAYAINFSCIVHLQGLGMRDSFSVPGFNNPTAFDLLPSSA